MKERADILWLDEIDSTNSELQRRISDFDNLSVLAAVNQTAGRGQRGNSWLVRPGENLTFSMLLKFALPSPHGSSSTSQGSDFSPRPTSVLFPDKTLASLHCPSAADGLYGSLPATAQFSISRAISLALIDYLDSKEVRAEIKWPNDIYVRGKKICGVLIENSLSGAFVASSIVGIGFNMNQREFPPHLINPVSLSIIKGKTFSTHEELEILCDCLVSRLRPFSLSGEERSGIIENQANEYVSRLYRLGESYDYVDCSDGSVFKGEIIGTTPEGKLKVKRKDGTVKEFAFKEISYII